MKNDAVVILGAGAMGAFFAYKLKAAPNVTPSFIASGERRKRLMADGLVVNGEKVMLPVLDPDNAGDIADLIIVALKHHHLESALPMLDSIVGPDTVMMSVMNGLDSEQIIASRFGMEKMLLAVSVGIDAVRTNNRVVFSKPGVHYFGRENNRELSEAVKRVQSIFERAGIDHKIPADMKRMLWWKFMINVGMNPSSAVMKAPYGVFQRSEEAQWLMKALMNEVIMLARASEVDLSQADLDDWIAVLGTLSPDGKTSMLQDMEAGVKTEIEMFCEKVVYLGQQLGVFTPVNRAVLNIVRVLERDARITVQEAAAH